MIKVLSTRIMRRSTVDAAGNAGIDITCYSFIETVTVISAALQQRIRGGHVLALTSVKAVESLQQNLAVSKEEMPAMELFCIEGKTREAALSAFPQLQLRASVQYAADLAAQIVASMAGSNGTVIYPCGNRRRGDLPQVLSRAGIKVEEIIAYETRLTPQKLPDQYDGYIFFSPTAVASFLSLNTLPAGAACFTIGQTTAGSLAGFNNPILVPPVPREEKLLETMKGYYR